MLARLIKSAPAIEAALLCILSVGLLTLGPASRATPDRVLRGPRCLPLTMRFVGSFVCLHHRDVVNLPTAVPFTQIAAMRQSYGFGWYFARFEYQGRSWWALLVPVWAMSLAGVAGLAFSLVLLWRARPHRRRGTALDPSQPRLPMVESAGATGATG